MKRLKWIATLLVVASIVLGVIGCNNPSGPSDSGNGGAQQGGANSGNFGEQTGGGAQQGGANGGNFGEQTGGGAQQGGANGGNFGGQTGGGTQGVVVPEGFELVRAGIFKMGSSEGGSYSKPVHEVTITKPFYMGKYEVTQAEYEKYCSYTGIHSPSSSNNGKGDNYPAYWVSWYDALVYCNKRSMAEGLTPCYSIDDSTDPDDWGEVPYSYGDSSTTWDAVICNWNANGYRLPTEAEWEYAARAGQTIVDYSIYSGTCVTINLDEYAWYDENSNDTTHEVGAKKANAFGLYDMSGNVREWCWNWITGSYDTEVDGGSDPTGASAGESRVYRGGSFYYGFSSCAVSNRSGAYPYDRSQDLGFRVVRQAN